MAQAPRERCVEDRVFIIPRWVAGPCVASAAAEPQQRSATEIHRSLSGFVDLLSSHKSCGRRPRRCGVPARRQRHGRHAAPHRSLPRTHGPPQPCPHPQAVRRQVHRRAQRPRRRRWGRQRRSRCCQRRSRGWCWACGSAGDAVHRGGNSTALGGGVQRAGARVGASTRP